MRDRCNSDANENIFSSSVHPRGNGKQSELPNCSLLWHMRAVQSMHYLAELINPAPSTTEIRSPADTQSVALSCLLSHSLSITHPKHMFPTWSCGSEYVKWNDTAGEIWKMQACFNCIVIFKFKNDCCRLEVFFFFSFKYHRTSAGTGVGQKLRLSLLKHMYNSISCRSPMKCG